MSDPSHVVLLNAPAKMATLDISRWSPEDKAHCESYAGWSFTHVPRTLEEWTEMVDGTVLCDHLGHKMMEWLRAISYSITSISGKPYPRVYFETSGRFLHVIEFVGGTKKGRIGEMKVEPTSNSIPTRLAKENKNFMRNWKKYAERLEDSIEHGEPNSDGWQFSTFSNALADAYMMSMIHFSQDLEMEKMVHASIYDDDTPCSFR
eukprot:gb/GECG01013050.1/.p1 GENE.gb/GECG01013050.1/~~gb/GECG01013050.1/.p1  ORF type:complete len:205 (+),score=24.15 gb/GECG01013050.1/:1-615(+)